MMAGCYARDGWVYTTKTRKSNSIFPMQTLSPAKQYKTGIFFDPNYFGSHVLALAGAQPYLHNNGDGTFQEAGQRYGTDLLLNSRGVRWLISGIVSYGYRGGGINGPPCPPKMSLASAATGFRLNSSAPGQTVMRGCPSSPFMWRSAAGPEVSAG